MAKFELKKGQSSPQFEKKKNDNSSAKMKEKQKNKLKEKLKSALSNERKPAAASIITEGKSQKITHKIPNKNVALAKATTPKISTESIKHNKANKHGKPSKPNENASRNDKIPHGNKRTNQSDKSDQQPVQKQSNHSKKMKMDKTSAQKNGHVVNNGHPKTDKMNGNKSKKMNKAKPAKQVNQQPIGDKKRNDSIPKASNVSKKKKMKTVGGFIETNADDKELNTVVHDNLTKKKKKKAKNSQNQQENGGTIAKGPAVKVISHEIDNDTANGTNSDSEADSYIDKFFGGNDAFDENRIYSLDEIEAQTENGFLSKISGGSSGSNESSPSEKMTHTKGKKRNSKAKGSPNNKVAVYKQNDEETSDDETDEDSSNYLNMMYGSDSEVSLGSEVSDDGEFADSQSDDSYDSNSTDVDSELMEEYEDDISYEGNSSDMDADDSESSASSDPYDDFLHSRHNSDGSSHEDHDYTGELDTQLTNNPNKAKHFHFLNFINKMFRTTLIFLNVPTRTTIELILYWLLLLFVVGNNFDACGSIEANTLEPHFDDLMVALVFLFVAWLCFRCMWPECWFVEWIQCQFWMSIAEVFHGHLAIWQQSLDTFDFSFVLSDALVRFRFE